MIDPSILLQSKPVDTWTSATQAQNLQNLGTQNQLQQQQLAQTKALAPGQLQSQQLQITGQGQENQQRQTQIDQTKALNDQMRQSLTPDSNGVLTLDRDKFTRGMVAAGQGSAVPAAMKSFNDADEALAKLKTTQASLVTAQADAAGALANPVKIAGYTPDAFGSMVAHSVAAKFITPQQGQQYLAAAQQDPTQIKAIVDQIRGASPAQVKLDTEAQASQAKADTAATGATKTAAELPGIVATSDQKQMQNIGTQLALAKDAASYAAILGEVPQKYAKQFPQTFDPATTPKAVLQAAMTPEQQTTAAQAAANAASTAQHQRVEESQGNQRIAIENQRVAVEKTAADPFGALGLNKNPIGGGSSGPNGEVLHGDAFLATLPPQMAATVKAVAEGRQTNLPRGGKELDQLMGAVNAYDPTYSVQRAQQRTAFTTGAQGKNIGNLNTAVVHLDQYHEVMKAMANGTFTPGNQLYNWAAEKLGAANVTNPDFVRQSLAGEAANALKGNATDPEIAGLMKTLGKDQSPAQQAGTAVEGLKILGTKLNTYDEQYHQISPDDPWSPVLPSAKAVFQRYGVSPLARTADAPNASATAPPPAGNAAKLAPAFKITATAPNGHKIGSNDGQKTWFDLSTGKKVQP